MKPFGISRGAMSGACQWMSLMFFQPFVQVEVVVLFAPKHPGQRLTMHCSFVFAQRRWSNSIVKLVRLCKAGSKGLIECDERIARQWLTQPQPHDLTLPGWYFQFVVRCCFCPCSRGIYRFSVTRDQELMKRVFDERRSIGLAPQPAGI